MPTLVQLLSGIGIAGLVTLAWWTKRSNDFFDTIQDASDMNPLDPNLLPSPTEQDNQILDAYVRELINQKQPRKVMEQELIDKYNLMLFSAKLILTYPQNYSKEAFDNALMFYRKMHALIAYYTFLQNNRHQG